MDKWDTLHNFIVRKMDKVEDKIAFRELASVLKEMIRISEEFNRKLISDNVENLQKRLERCELALDKEVWNSKLGKFMKFRDMPEVAKVLNDEQTQP